MASDAGRRFAGPEIVAGSGLDTPEVLIIRNAMMLRALASGGCGDIDVLLMRIRTEEIHYYGFSTSPFGTLQNSPGNDR